VAVVDPTAVGVAEEAHMGAVAAAVVARTTNVLSCRFATS
jgi:hypothetical protein